MDRSLSRREALGAAGLVGVSALIARADEAKSVSGPFAGPPVITSTNSLSPQAGAGYTGVDGKSFTLAFDTTLDDLGIVLDCKILSATKLVTFNVPVKVPADRSLIGYRTTISGFVQKDKESRVVIIADIAGTTKVVEYPFGQEIAEGNCALNVEIAFFCADAKAAVAGELAPPQEFSGTISLLVQKRSPEALATAAIDGVDAVAILSASF